MNNDRIALGKLLVSTATTTGNVDVPALNAGLSVLAAHKRIGSAMTYFHETFAENGLKPDKTSVKTVIEMLVNSRRIDKALAFKEEVGDDMMNLESYSHLIKFFGDNKRVLEGIEMFRECTDKLHGSIPAEK
jgi:hypothetical protein